MLTLTIKPNDEVTLKKIMPSNLSKHKHIDWPLLSEQRVVVQCSCAISYAKDTKSSTIQIATDYMINVKTRSNFSLCIPISAINKSYCLRRDHKRIDLHHKTLICQ